MVFITDRPLRINIYIRGTLLLSWLLLLHPRSTVCVCVFSCTYIGIETYTSIGIFVIILCEIMSTMIIIELQDDDATSALHRHAVQNPWVLSTRANSVRLFFFFSSPTWKIRVSTDFRVCIVPVLSVYNIHIIHIHIHVKYIHV